MLTAIFNNILSALAELLDALVSWFMSVLSMDLTMYVNYFPFLGSVYSILQGFSIGLTAILAGKAIATFWFGSLDGSNPQDRPAGVLFRAFFAAIGVYWGGYVLSAIVDLGKVPFDILKDANAAQYSFGQAGDTGEKIGVVAAEFFGGVAGDLTVVFVNLIITILILINFAKLMVEVCERYLVVGILVYTSPLIYCTFPSRETSGIFKKWVSMFVGSVLQMSMSVLFLKLIVSGMSQINQGNGPLRLMLILAMTKIAQRVDTYLQQIGVGVATTGGNMLDDMMGLVHSMRRMGGRSGGSSSSVMGKGGSSAGSVLGRIWGGTALGGAVKGGLNAFRNNTNIKDGMIQGMKDAAKKRPSMFNRMRQSRENAAAKIEGRKANDVGTITGNAVKVAKAGKQEYQNQRAQGKGAIAAATGAGKKAIGDAAKSAYKNSAVGKTISSVKDAAAKGESKGAALRKGLANQAKISARGVGGAAAAALDPTVAAFVPGAQELADERAANKAKAASEHMTDKDAAAVKPSGATGGSDKPLMTGEGELTKDAKDNGLEMKDGENGAFIAGENESAVSDAIAAGAMMGEENELREAADDDSDQIGAEMAAGLRQQDQALVDSHAGPIPSQTPEQRQQDAQTMAVTNADSVIQAHQNAAAAKVAADKAERSGDPNAAQLRANANRLQVKAASESRKFETATTRSAPTTQDVATYKARAERYQANAAQANQRVAKLEKDGAPADVIANARTEASAASRASEIATNQYRAVSESAATSDVKNAQYRLNNPSEYGAYAQSVSQMSRDMYQGHIQSKFMNDTAEESYAADVRAVAANGGAGDTAIQSRIAADTAKHNLEALETQAMQQPHLADELAPRIESARAQVEHAEAAAKSSGESFSTAIQRKGSFSTAEIGQYEARATECASRASAAEARVSEMKSSGTASQSDIARAEYVAREARVRSDMAAEQYATVQQYASGGKYETYGTAWGQAGSEARVVRAERAASNAEERVQMLEAAHADSSTIDAARSEAVSLRQAATESRKVYSDNTTPEAQSAYRYNPDQDVGYHVTHAAESIARYRAHDESLISDSNRARVEQLEQRAQSTGSVEDIRAASEAKYAIEAAETRQNADGYYESHVAEAAMYAYREDRAACSDAAVAHVAELKTRVDSAKADFDRIVADSGSSQADRMAAYNTYQAVVAAHDAAASTVAEAQARTMVDSVYSQTAALQYESYAQQMDVISRTIRNNSTFASGSVANATFDLPNNSVAREIGFKVFAPAITDLPETGGRLSSFEAISLSDAPERTGEKAFNMSYLDRNGEMRSMSFINQQAYDHLSIGEKQGYTKATMADGREYWSRELQAPVEAKRESKVVGMIKSGFGSGKKKRNK